MADNLLKFIFIYTLLPEDRFDFEQKIEKKKEDDWRKESRVEFHYCLRRSIFAINCLLKLEWHVPTHSSCHCPIRETNGTERSVARDAQALAPTLLIFVYIFFIDDDDDDKKLMRTFLSLTSLLSLFVRCGETHDRQRIVIKVEEFEIL